MKKWLMLFLVSLLFLTGSATNLVVQVESGSGLSQNIDLIGKWIYVGNNLALLDKQGNILGWEAISNIHKIVFMKDITTEDAPVIQDNVYVIYPNPTQDILHIRGLADTTTVRIFDMQGKLLRTGIGAQIAVDDIPNGTYLLQFMTQVTRFIKQ